MAISLPLNDHEANPLGRASELGGSIGAGGKMRLSLLSGPERSVCCLRYVQVA